MHSVNYGSDVIIKRLILLLYAVAAYNSYCQKSAVKCDDIVVYTIRKATIRDQQQLKLLYQKVSLQGGLARTYDEITDAYIEKNLRHGIENGLALVVEYDSRLIGSMIKYKLEPAVFSHVLAEGSILIDPAFQGKGIGTKLIATFLKEVQQNHPDVLRVEITARESNSAIKLYKKLGFRREGRFEGRIRGVSGKLEPIFQWFGSIPLFYGVI